MKLYYSPGACSLSPRIVALEAGLDLAYEKVDGKAKRTESGKDFWQINPKGYVPALQLDDGAVLTEGPAIVQYLADLRPASALAPANGSLARYRLQEALGYINSELHKSFSPLFNPATPEATREERKEYLRRRYALIEATLTRHPYLLADDFTVADAYLFTVTRWAQFVDLDLTAFPHLQAFQQLVAARPAVARALEAEGLLKKAA